MDKAYGEGNQAIYYKWENNTLIESDKNNANVIVNYSDINSMAISKSLVVAGMA